MVMIFNFLVYHSLSGLSRLLLEFKIISRSLASFQKVTAKDTTNTRDRSERLFEFDHVFDDRVGQSDIFDKVC
jgi:hypothetical protein